MDENIPYHTWDFILFPLMDNPLLIDLDGSAHSPSTFMFKHYGKSYTEREKIDYRDSQHPYQIADNMDAIIIRCFDDKLSDETPIATVVENEYYLYKNLMKYISERFTQLKLNNRQKFIDYRTTSSIDKMLNEVKPVEYP